MKKIAGIIVSAVSITGLLLCTAVNPPKVEAVPSFARQTGLPCSGCHYNPPELNPAGRKFKLLGYVQKADETKVVKAEGGKTRAPLELLASLPLSVMVDVSFTSTKSPVPNTSSSSTPLPPTQNGNFEFPQDVSLFLSGAWTTHVGSFLQVTYSTQDDHFSMDNTDVRYANLTKLNGKEFVYGLDLNNNPTVEDLWNSTPVWGYPWVASDVAPTPSAAAIINGTLGQDVAGAGAFAMWDDHLYGTVTLYRSQHIGGTQPNPGDGSAFNIRGVAPYWRVAWQQLSPKTQFMIGSYGMHMRSTPNAVTGPEDSYTDFAFDTQIDQTLFRKDVLSFRATYIRENSDLIASFLAGAAAQSSHHLNTVLANAEYHFGNKYSGTFGWFNTTGTADALLFPAGSVTGSANGSPTGAGYIANFSVWPWQNLQLAAQYTGYTRFNGGSTNYDGSGRNASANNTVYLDIKFLF
jgi:hypothetical protein